MWGRRSGRALAMAPADTSLQLGLVRTFLRQEKTSAALALVEAMVKRPDGPAEVFVIHARLLAARGEIPAAIAQYRLGIERDPDATDADFEARFGLGAHARIGIAGEQYHQRHRARRAHAIVAGAPRRRARCRRRSIGGDGGIPLHSREAAVVIAPPPLPVLLRQE